VGKYAEDIWVGFKLTEYPLSDVFSRRNNRLIVAWGGIERNRCTASWATRPFRIFTSWLQPSQT